MAKRLSVYTQVIELTDRIKQHTRHHQGRAREHLLEGDKRAAAESMSRVLFGG
jgi:hypothetical protein